MFVDSAAILIAEDDSNSGLYLQQLLEREGYRTELVRNGQEALEKYQQQNYDVVISDLMMPVMDGEQLLQELSRFEDPPVFLLETGSDDRDEIIKMIRKGASDYYIKPIQRDVFLPKVQNAIEVSRKRRALRKVTAEREQRLDQHLDWNIIKERVLSRTNDKFDKLFFSSLKSSLTQGAGIGSTVSLISLISKTKQEQGEFSLVRNDLLKMLFHNAGLVERVLRLISEIYALFDRDLPLEKTSLADFYNILRTSISRGKKYSEIRSHQFYFNDIDYRNHHGCVMVDPELMGQVFYELFINSCKFSISNSEIYIFTNCTKDHFFISFMNRPDPNLMGATGLRKGFENLVFEPFYRLGNYVYEEYDTTDFGLGLCFVEKVVRKNNGSIELSQIKDDSHFNHQPSNFRLCFEISLPIVSGL